MTRHASRLAIVTTLTSVITMAIAAPWLAAPAKAAGAGGLRAGNCDFFESGEVFPNYKYPCTLHVTDSGIRSRLVVEGAQIAFDGNMIDGEVIHREGEDFVRSRYGRGWCFNGQITGDAICFRPD